MPSWLVLAPRMANISGKVSRPVLVGSTDRKHKTQTSSRSSQNPSALRRILSSPRSFPRTSWICTVRCHNEPSTPSTRGVLGHTRNSPAQPRTGTQSYSPTRFYGGTSRVPNAVLSWARRLWADWTNPLAGIKLCWGTGYWRLPGDGGLFDSVHENEACTGIFRRHVLCWFWAAETQGRSTEEVDYRALSSELRRCSPLEVQACSDKGRWRPDRSAAYPSDSLHGNQPVHLRTTPCFCTSGKTKQSVGEAESDKKTSRHIPFLVLEISRAGLDEKEAILVNCPHEQIFATTEVLFIIREHT